MCRPPSRDRTKGPRRMPLARRLAKGQPAHLLFPFDLCAVVEEPQAPQIKPQTLRFENRKRWANAKANATDQQTRLAWPRKTQRLAWPERHKGSPEPERSSDASRHWTAYSAHTPAVTICRQQAAMRTKPASNLCTATTPGEHHRHNFEARGSRLTCEDSLTRLPATSRRRRPAHGGLGGSRPRAPPC